MADAQKKVVVRQQNGRVAWGYLPARGLVREGGVELMEPDGRLNQLLLKDLQWIAYVRDWNRDDPADPERLGRRRFLGRPRLEGLWLRVGLCDETDVEGLTSLDLGALDGLLEDGGLSLTPPDPRSNVMRLFVPRGAIRSLEVLGWVSPPGRRAARTAGGKANDGQSELFPAEELE